MGTPIVAGISTYEPNQSDITREEEAIGRDILVELELARGTAYCYVTRLVDAGDDEV